jgi:hypothetical protein
LRRRFGLQATHIDAIDVLLVQKKTLHEVEEVLSGGRAI